MSMTPNEGMTLEEFAQILRTSAEVCAEQIEEAIENGDKQEQHYARGSRDAYLWVLRVMTNDKEGYIQ